MILKFATLVLSSAFLVAVLFGGSAIAQDSEQSTIPAVTVASVEEREVRAVVPVSGTVRAYSEVFITPQLNGVQIQQIRVESGDWVNAGDVLVRLRPDLYEAQLAQAKAEVQRAESLIRQSQNQISSTEAAFAESTSEFERTQLLFENGSLSRASLDQVATRTENARAAAASARDQLAIYQAAKAQADSQLQIAELNLRWTDITSPVTGMIGERNANVGALTSAGAPPLLTVYEGGTFELSAEVIETAIGDIENGDGGNIVVSGVGALIGTVRFVSSTVDGVTRLGGVRIGLQHDDDLRTGLFGRGEIETERRMALTVPITAVLSDDLGSYVQIIENGRILRREIVPGLIWQNWREVIEGLEEGEVVIARAGAFFRDGDRVRIVETAEADQ